MDGHLHQDKTFEKISVIGQSILDREFENCIFKLCDFSEANLAGTRFTDCTFIGCNLSNVKLNKVRLATVKFSDCKMLGIVFSDTDDFSFSVTFEKCILDYSSFMNKKMQNSKFINTSIKDSNFANANLSKSLFNNCNLEGTLFNGSNLTEVNFSNAYGFSIDPELNKINKATFSMQGAITLLDKYKLKIE